MFEIEILRIELVKRRGSNKSTDDEDQSLSVRHRDIEIDGKSISPYALRRDSQPAGLKNILLKGQMQYLNDIASIIYLCSPM